MSLRPSEARELTPGGGGAVSPPPPPLPNGAGAELRKILNFSASRTPNIVFPGHLRTKILSFIKRKIRRISITQLLSCIIITNDTYYVQLLDGIKAFQKKHSNISRIYCYNITSDWLIYFQPIRFTEMIKSISRQSEDNTQAFQFLNITA